MTIDEAIQYAEDLGTEGESKIDYDKDSPHTIIRRKNTVKDYRQLAEWLQELKQWRENPFKMIKDICAAHDWCPDCQLSDHCTKASGWALSYPSEWEVE